MEDYHALKLAFFDKENQLHSQQKHLLTALVNAKKFGKESQKAAR